MYPIGITFRKIYKYLELQADLLNSLFITCAFHRLYFVSYKSYLNILMLYLVYANLAINST